MDGRVRAGRAGRTGGRLYVARGIQLTQGAAGCAAAIILSGVAVAFYRGIRRALIAPISQYDKSGNAIRCTLQLRPRIVIVGL